MSRSMDLHDHYLNYRLPDEIPENLVEFCQEDDGLTYEEVVLQQQSVYQSFQERAKKNIAANDNANANANAAYDDDMVYWAHLLEDEGESSSHKSFMTQEAIDEVLARSLQELEEDFGDIDICEHSGAQNPVPSPSRVQAASSNSNQDSIDPDSMQYEELLHLTEAMGTENRGISATRISQLPTSKYRSGLFLKNKKKEDNCVICQMEFNSGEKLITLPCLHQYHSSCISHWLKMKKNCPICQKEVV